MKTAIFTLNIGDTSGLLPGMLSAKNYAQKHGISYFVADQLAIRFYSVAFEKFQCFKLFDMGYDRVLMLDGDVLVTPDAPNIFECYPDMDTLYAFDENAPARHMERDHIVTAINSGIDWPKNEKGKYRYFNAGVVLLSKNFEDFFAGYRDVYNDNIPEMQIFHEQTCMNYLVAKKGIKFESLDYCWNRMDMGVPDPQNKRYEANFIHYAGPAFVHDEDRCETMRRDFIHFYGERPLKEAGGRIAYQRLPRGPAGAKAEAQQVGGLNKKCSIIFIGAENSSEVSSYLRYLSADRLPADYELLFHDKCLPQMELAYSESIKAIAKIITLIYDVDFDLLCIEVARQARGEYILFVNDPVSKEEVFEAVRQLGDSGMNIGIGSGRKYIIVKRLPFLDAGGLDGLLSKSEQLMRS